MFGKNKILTAYGFSLIEIMSVIAIIGLLIIVSHAGKKIFFDHQSEAEVKAFLLQVSNRQTSYWQRHGRYAATLSQLTIVTPKSLLKHYKIELKQSFLPSGYVVVAVPLMANKKEQTLWLNHLGATSENWRY